MLRDDGGVQAVQRDHVPRHQPHHLLAPPLRPIQQREPGVPGGPRQPLR